MGTKITLMNYNAPVHYPNGVGPQISEVMQFHVTKPLSAEDDTTPPKKLRLPTVEEIMPKPDTRRREWVIYQHVLFGTMTLKENVAIEMVQAALGIGQWHRGLQHKGRGNCGRGRF